jgi:hypothetical protein
MEIQKQEMVEI